MFIYCYSMICFCSWLLYMLGMLGVGPLCLYFSWNVPSESSCESWSSGTHFHKWASWKRKKKLATHVSICLAKIYNTSFILMEVWTVFNWSSSLLNCVVGWIYRFLEGLKVTGFGFQVFEDGEGFWAAVGGQWGLCSGPMVVDSGGDGCWCTIGCIVIFRKIML